MASLRSQVVQAHIARLQSKLASRAVLEKAQRKLELDPHEIELFLQKTALRNGTPPQHPPSL
jgi:hypothetical protein